TFRPFYEESFPAMVDHEPGLIAHQHGQWQDDYRQQIPTLHDPARGKQVAVAVDDASAVIGYVAWLPDSTRPHHGIVYLLAVDAGRRRSGTATALMEHAMTAMRDTGMRGVELGTGGDDF